jgi:hypothetical protein
MVAFIHAAWLLVCRAVAKGRNLFFLLRDTLAEARQARISIEKELFRGRYHLSSKNDDDLPVVR